MADVCGLLHPQAKAWTWLATDLPKLHTLLLTNYDSHKSDARWPAALPDCTGLECLRLQGTAAAPIPSGQYLSGLTTLECLGSRQPHGVSALPEVLTFVPEVLAAATRLEELTLGVESQHAVNCSNLDRLPNLRKLSFWVEKDFHLHVNDLLRIQQRLCGVKVTCEFETKANMSFRVPVPD